MNDENTYGTTGITSQVAVQATDTSGLVGASYDTNTLTYNTAGRYQISNNSTVNHNIVFHAPGGKEVGRMDFNSGELVFEGDANEAAKVFTEWARRHWSDLRDKDRVEVLDAVIHDIIAESSGELYSEEEKVAMLTCLQIVQGQKNTYVAPQVESSRGYAQNLAKQAPLTPTGLQAQAMAAILPEGTVQETP